MRTTLLRLATERRLGYRKWDNLRLGWDVGHVRMYSGLLITPVPRKGIWFWWDFHEHRGGAEGRLLPHYREEVRERVKHLIRWQELETTPIVLANHAKRLEKEKRKRRK